MLGKEEKRPSFDRTLANKWFSKRYSTSVSLSQRAVSWFPRVMKSLIWGQLGQVMWDLYCPERKPEHSWRRWYPKNLESTHLFLATLFTKTLLTSPAPWEGWGTSSVILIHKGGKTGEPTNFRPTVLTSVVGKVFHQILSERICELVVGFGYVHSVTGKLLTMPSLTIGPCMWYGSTWRMSLEVSHNWIPMFGQNVLACQR